MLWGPSQVTYGGTWVEEWTRASVVPQCGEVPHSNSTTGQIFNAMVYPIINFTTHLTLYYQGETNTDSSADALHFGCMFSAMVTDLRQHQRGPLSPFYFVLLAPAHNGTNGSLPLIQGWASQLRALALPNTAIANTIDLGDNSPLINELHPRNKSLIGQRLARIALNNLYNQPMVIRGPALHPQSDIRIERVSQSQLNVTFTFPANADNSVLHVMGTAECESCCDGRRSALFGVSLVNGSGPYWPQSVRVDVEHRTLHSSVTLPTSAVQALSGATLSSATNVRIDFENAVSYPECALYNEANLPALPFSVELTVQSAQAFPREGVIQD